MVLGKWWFEVRGSSSAKKKKHILLQTSDGTGLIRIDLAGGVILAARPRFQKLWVKEYETRLTRKNRYFEGRTMFRNGLSEPRPRCLWQWPI